MTSPLAVAASLPFETRKCFAIHVMAGSEPISHVAEREGVSRKFIYEQAQKGRQVSFPDALITATALEHDLTLVTTNVRHFVSLLGERVMALSQALVT